MTSNCKLNLRQYELDNQEWNISVNLRDMLKIFKHATLFFSCNTPSISTVIPAMDHIDAHIATVAQDMDLPVSIRAALAIGKKTLNRYYNKTDHLEVYSIAMVLQPRHKLQYFKTAGWEDNWIETAQTIVRKEFD
ncbi:hypothetical protein B0H34DRAFT_755232 [Crassisporium funariophilum]|nr:hypothetical protein B0H34DRAFT_774893 [Crassisporium funariophilum]KAF8152455.1 hypothetical protein B0H34DRAFT_755232 [Crassisporium funariophilum]